MTIRTRSPKSYILPSRSEMRKMADEAKVKNFCPSLVEDICNLIAGGDYNLPSEMIPMLEDSLQLSKHSDGDYQYDGNYLKDEKGNYVKDAFLANKLAAKKAVTYHQRVQDFLRSLDLNVPGSSPLEQAMNILKLLATQQGGTPGQDGETLPIFSEERSPESVAQQINEAVDTAESLDETEDQLLNPEGEKGTVEIAEDMMSGKKIMLEVKRQLDNLVKLKTSKSTKLTSDPEGNEVRYRGMKELSEMDKLNPAEFAYPNRYRTYRMLTGVTQVRERCTREEKKMLLYIICDYSGSMSDGNRFWKAGGVLMNRLKAVIEGDAEVFFSFFDDSLDKEHQATNAEEAQKLMEKIKKNNFQGGGTKIADCTCKAVQRIVEKLTQNPHLTKPELLVVTDGDDDTSSLSLADLQGVRLHTLITGGNNQHIVNLAQKSGGVGIANL